MKRSAALAGLSRDHHEALAVALRLRRSETLTAAEAAERFAEYFARRGERHFELEEAVLVPLFPSLPDGEALRERLLREHAALRKRGAPVAAGQAPVDDLHRLGEALEAHVRFEERELFPLLERELSDADLAEVGKSLAAAHAD